MRAEQLHVINFNTGAVPFAVNLAGAVPAAVGITSDQRYGYRLYAITQSDNDEIWSVRDFAGRNVAHSEPSSNSGHQAPSALFAQLHDTEPGEAYEVNFSGGHEQTTRGVIVGDYDCGPVCSSCARDVIVNSDRFDGTGVKAVWGSDPFPPGPMSYRYNLHPDIIEGIEAMLFDYTYEDTAWEEGTEYVRFQEVDYKSHWDIILTIQEYNGVEYEEGALGS